MNSSFMICNGPLDDSYKISSIGLGQSSTKRNLKDHFVFSNTCEQMVCMIYFTKIST